MSSEIPGIREVNPFKPSYINGTADMAKGLNINEKGAALVREVVGLLASERSVRVTNTYTAPNAELGKPVGPTGTPQLDNPNDAKAKDVDLEKLLAFIQLAFDEKQAKMAQERINSKRDSLDTRFQEQKEKLKESFKKMDKAAKAGLFSKIFGWVVAAIAVAAAVAVSVASGGLAVGPLVGALIAIGGCVLNETEATDKITDFIAKGLEKIGFDKNTSKMLAQVAFAVAMMAAALSCGRIDGVIQMGQVAAKIAEFAATAAKVSQTVLIGSGIVGTVAGGVSSGLNYEAMKSQASLTEAEKFLAIMRQSMEDNEDELEQIMNKIQGVFSDIVDILESKTDTLDTIAMNIGQKA